MNTQYTLIIRAGAQFTRVLAMAVAQFLRDKAPFITINSVLLCVQSWRVVNKCRRRVAKQER